MGFNAFAGGKRAITAAFDDIWAHGGEEARRKELAKNSGMQYNSRSYFELLSIICLGGEINARHHQ